VRIIVCFRGLKKSRILIAILDFLSPLKWTIIRAFSVISFYKWYYTFKAKARFKKYPNEYNEDF